MGWIRRTVDEALEKASTCGQCQHSDSAGVPDCECTASNCACG